LSVQNVSDYNYNYVLGLTHTSALSNGLWSVVVNFTYYFDNFVALNSVLMFCNAVCCC